MTEGGSGGSGRWVADLWYLMAGRIAPPLCCTSPPPAFLLVRQAIREIGEKNGDIDQAVLILRDLISSCPSEGFVYEQAGQLLNIIGWRQKYHQEWFSRDVHGTRLHTGRCGQHIAHALALMNTGSDDEAMELSGRIIREGTPGSDDITIAHLIRAAIQICTGEIDAGETELALISAGLSGNQRD